MSQTSLGSNGNDNGTEIIDLSLMDGIIQKYGQQKGALIPMLQQAQDIYGYLSPEVLKLIARKQGVSVGKVYGVATFYAQFYLEKRGKHILKLCDGTACHVKGTPMLVTALEESFGIKPSETTEDGELTVEIVYCVGSCAIAPVTILDDQVMGRVKPNTIVRKIQKHMKDTQKALEAQG